MKIIGLTGSIGMGKTTTAAMFADRGVPVWNADAAVHRLYAKGGKGVKPVSDLFPGALQTDGSINRDILSSLILNNSENLKRLEAVVHPLVGQDRSEFMAAARAQNAPMVLIDVPLLFETGGEAYVDQVIVVTCDAARQRQRVLARPGMTEAKLASILNRQTPDAEKRLRADFIITTDVSFDDTQNQVEAIYRQLLALPVSAT